jgi:hypothetical protein
MMLREFHRVLRPGGLLLIGELGVEVYEAFDTDVPASASSPRIHQGLKVIREAVASQGVMLDALPLIPKWLEADSGLWSVPPPPTATPLVRTRKRGFTGIETRTVHIPNGTWHPDPIMQRVGAMAQEVWQSTWMSIIPMLLERGLDPPTVRNIVEGAVQELMDPAIQTVWKYMMIHCIKI